MQALNTDTLQDAIEAQQDHMRYIYNGYKSVFGEANARVACKQDRAYRRAMNERKRLLAMMPTASDVSEEEFDR